MVKELPTVMAIRHWIEVLAAQDRLEKIGRELIEEFSPVSSPIPHIDHLPDEVYCWIPLKDASQTISCHSYGCPRKYRNAWQTLIHEHQKAGRICPSSSDHASPSFIIPKSDPTVLPRWVNDYRILNANMVIDKYLFPWMDDIFVDCAKGKIWSKVDMTNSFFQM